MSDQNAQEPTMEEILASIRRIISEDEPTADAKAEEDTATPPHGDDMADEEDDILELTQRVEPETAPPAARPDPFPAAQTSGDLDIYERPAPAPTPPTPSFAPAPAMATAYDEDEDEEADFGGALVSEPAAASASSAFDQLARTVTMPAESRSLEDVVRELLRPLLKQWLDQNLPGIVETAVEAEVERISRRRFS